MVTRLREPSWLIILTQSKQIRQSWETEYSVEWNYQCVGDGGWDEGQRSRLCAANADDGRYRFIRDHRPSGRTVASVSHRVASLCAASGRAQVRQAAPGRLRPREIHYSNCPASPLRCPPVGSGCNSLARVVSISLKRARGSA